MDWQFPLRPDLVGRVARIGEEAFYVEPSLICGELGVRRCRASFSLTIDSRSVRQQSIDSRQKEYMIQHEARIGYAWDVVFGGPPDHFFARDDRTRCLLTWPNGYVLVVDLIRVSMEAGQMQMI